MIQILCSTGGQEQIALNLRILKLYKDGGFITDGLGLHKDLCDEGYLDGMLKLTPKGQQFIAEFPCWDGIESFGTYVSDFTPAMKPRPRKVKPKLDVKPDNKFVFERDDEVIMMLNDILKSLYHKGDAEIAYKIESVVFRLLFKEY